MLVDSNKRPRPSNNAGWLTKRSLASRKTSLQPPRARRARDIALSRRRVAKSRNRVAWCPRKNDGGKSRRIHAAPKSARRAIRVAEGASRECLTQIHHASCRRASQGCVARYVRVGVEGEERRARRGSEASCNRAASVTERIPPRLRGGSRHRGRFSCFRAREEDDSSFRILVFKSTCNLQRQNV